MFSLSSLGISIRLKGGHIWALLTLFLDVKKLFEVVEGHERLLVLTFFGEY